MDFITQLQQGKLNGAWYVIETPDFMTANLNILYAFIIGFFLCFIIDNFLKK